MEDWQVVNSAMTSDAFCSDYCNHCENTVDPKSMWTTKSAKKCKKSMAVIAEMSSRGQLSQNHAMGPWDGPYAKEAREFLMGAFLIAAGELSYFT